MRTEENERKEEEEERGETAGDAAAGGCRAPPRGGFLALNIDLSEGDPEACLRIDRVKGLRGSFLNLEASGGLRSEVATFRNVTGCYRPGYMHAVMFSRRGSATTPRKQSVTFRNVATS